MIKRTQTKHKLVKIKKTNSIPTIYVKDLIGAQNPYRNMDVEKTNSINTSSAKFYDTLLEKTVDSFYIEYLRNKKTNNLAPWGMLVSLIALISSFSKNEDNMWIFALILWTIVIVIFVLLGMMRSKSDVYEYILFKMKQK